MHRHGHGRKFLYVEIPAPVKRVKPVGHENKRPQPTTETATTTAVNNIALPKESKGKEKARDHEEEPANSARITRSRTRSRSPLPDTGTNTNGHAAASSNALWNGDSPGASSAFPSFSASDSVQQLAVPAVPGAPTASSQDRLADLLTPNSQRSKRSSKSRSPTPNILLTASEPPTAAKESSARPSPSLRRSTRSLSRSKSPQPPNASTSTSLAPAGSLKTQTVASTDIPELYKPGIDEDIVKILGRKRFGSDYVYTVKLGDRKRVTVSETALDTYQDLLQDFDELAQDGWREDGKEYTDSSDDEDTTSMSKRKKRKSDHDDAYSMDIDEGAEQGEEEADVEEDSSAEGSPADSDDIHSPVKASRRSNREAARKRIDYSKQAEYDEEDDEIPESSESSSSESDSSDMPSKMRRANIDSDSDLEVASGPTRGIGRSQASKAARMLLDDENSGAEEFIEGGEKEGDLRAEQLHNPSCSNCKASSARLLLPEYIKKERRKRKKQKNNDEEWDSSSIRAYGSWIQCEVCSSSWHWKCLPGYTSASGMKVIFKKMVDVKYGQGAHLNINQTFKIASCPDCLKPQGSTCKFCLQAEPVTDITKGKEKTTGPSQDQQAPSDAITDVAALKKAAPGAPVPPSKLADSATANTGGSAALSSGEPIEAEGPEAIEEATSSGKDLLFRCSQCKRAAHYSCISTPDPTDLWQYSWDWHCDDCKTWGPIDAILAWRPLDWGKEKAEGVETPPPTSPKQVFVGSPGKRPPVMVNIPDHKATWWNAEYLVKFKETSFRQATWVPHSWLFSAYRQRLRNFLDKGPLIDITPDNATRDGEDDVLDDHLENFSLVPMPNALDLIPREWLTPDRILDVRLSRKHGGGPDPRVLNMKHRISDDPQETLSRVSEMYVKWQGLPYDAATWETDIPKPGEPMYDQFVKAYGEYLKFRNVEIPKPSQKELAILDRARPKSQFKELTEQPSFITLGRLMDFQLLGVSWLYYNWWIKKGCILADEMGLGKTVQIISFLSILYKTEICKPFLVVVPNSTLQNWQREFARWAPDDMRVVPYYGTRASRRIIEEYELFSSGSVSEQKLRTHVVLTTYECLNNDTALLKRVPRWEALVIDEAQRIKSGPKNLLWRSLKTLRFGHTVLLTGTPVNNNLDELFNLLFFLDPSNFRNLDELHTRYANLTPALVQEVQDLAQPYFLRRTKEAVLNLPPLSEVIVPLSMSPLQKVVYKSVLEKNMDALKAIYDASKAKSKKKVMTGKVVNVLMELRKTLCHPYLVREELEHDTGDFQTMHKNLVEASSKLTFLADFLPKLKQRGHRVLLFSQFVMVLNNIERFLKGMNLKFVRLDGNTSQADRQKHIDAYNAEDSDIFIFILTTRAGGVGINLATADTVILFDADFNPFQDLQAISRAHRIGQKNKVMCFKLMVKGTCEEKIIETGKKKMVLEQLIVDSKDSRGDDDEEAVNNVESLLLFGAQALFNEEPEAAAKNQIVYSDRDMNDLITRTENEEPSAEELEAKKKRTIEANKAFSYARVWDRQVRAEEEEADKREVEAQRGFWSKMIEANEKMKKDEELARQMAMGRGFRRRQQTNYNVYANNSMDSPASSKRGADSDTEDEDFNAADLSDASDADETDPAILDREDLSGIDIHKDKRPKFGLGLDGQLPDGAPLAPIRPTGPVYTNPLPIPIPSNQPPHPRYELARSPTPPDIANTRKDLLRKLLTRAELLQNFRAVDLIRQASKATSSLEQVRLCQEAAELLRAAAVRHSDPAGSSSSSVSKAPGALPNGPVAALASAQPAGLGSGLGAYSTRTY